MFESMRGLLSFPLMIEIDDHLTIPEAELEFITSRSSGPGGQNVNKVETRVTLLFDVDGSPSLDDEQRERIHSELATRINKQGVLRVSVQRHRSQVDNRKEAVERFAAILAQALDEDPERRSTKVPRSSRRRRLENKKHRGRVKELRQMPKKPKEW